MIFVRNVTITDEAVVLEYGRTEDAVAANGIERLAVMAVPVGVCDDETEALITAAEVLAAAAEAAFAEAGPMQFDVEDDDAPGPYDNPNDRQGEA